MITIKGKPRKDKKKKVPIPKHCIKCLRNAGTRCKALADYQNPCWAYIDDKEEYLKREKERADYEPKTNVYQLYE